VTSIWFYYLPIEILMYEAEVFVEHLCTIRNQSQFLLPTLLKLAFRFRFLLVCRVTVNFLIHNFHRSECHCLSVTLRNPTTENIRGYYWNSTSHFGVWESLHIYPYSEFSLYQLAIWLMPVGCLRHISSFIQGLHFLNCL
jgi:hypothetical protein